MHAVGMNQDAYLGKSRRMQTKDAWIPVCISYFLMFLYSAVNKDSVTNIQVSQETLSNVQQKLDLLGNVVGFLLLLQLS